MAHLSVPLPPPATFPYTPIIVKGNKQVLPSTAQTRHLLMATYRLSQNQDLALVVLNPVIKGESGDSKPPFSSSALDMLLAAKTWCFMHLMMVHCLHGEDGISLRPSSPSPNLHALPIITSCSSVGHERVLKGLERCTKGRLKNISMAVKGDSALFDRAKDAIPVTTLISQDAMHNTHAPNISMEHTLTVFFDILPATNCLEAVYTFTEAFMIYACNGMMGRALREGKRRKSYNWKGWNKKGKWSQDEERPISDSQDGRFDNVTVDPTLPNHSQQEPARHLVTSATSFATLLELAKDISNEYHHYSPSVHSVSKYSRSLRFGTHRGLSVLTAKTVHVHFYDVKVTSLGLPGTPSCSIPICLPFVLRIQTCAMTGKNAFVEDWEGCQIRSRMGSGHWMTMDHSACTSNYHCPDRPVSLINLWHPALALISTWTSGHRACASHLDSHRSWALPGSGYTLCTSRKVLLFVLRQTLSKD
ncbi:hypothetical protein ARMGADRAFT_1026231 [Armillaria gallica]|uniref:Uncharacterized protein n=1 Tax=Armillaria gallica TaxID=47427 RepID=A0A2H3EC97_ARMGA|nr:hypothetical protein ARMGADRAFT_1026231 [Armillaria gallica]